MLHPETHLVTAENGPRPAGKPDRCFYCSQPLGSQHAPKCVCRERTVVVRAVIEYVIEVPESWTAEQIEFQRNDGSWCATNLIGELREIHEAGACLCPITSFEYLREATAEEDAASPYASEYVASQEERDHE